MACINASRVGVVQVALHIGIFHRRHLERMPKLLQCCTSVAATAATS
jgi:hypothetical protein